MIRAANTGVTCFVNGFGRVTQVLQDDAGNTFTEGVLIGEINVPQDRQLTFYARHGELFAKICAGMTAIAIVVVLGLGQLGRGGSSEPPGFRARNARAAGDGVNRPYLPSR